MARQQMSLKQLAINKDNSTIVLVVGLASFIIVFSLVASNALVKQSRYQSKVISKKEKTLKQLETNATEVDKLKESYKTFAEQQKNVLDGNAQGQGDKDGENPRLVLDALPSKYDFPALTSSLEKMFRPYNLDTITGTDDEIAQSAAPSSGTPQPIEIPFSMSMKASQPQTKDALQLFERSIRPFQIQKVTMTGESNQVKLNVTAKTFFQPQKKFELKTEKVKP